jgi:4-hydroxybenzoyl-CoA thioesterase
MFTNRRTVTIEWGDCDPAGIVYYPRYFAMFDASTAALFRTALGYDKFEMIRRFGIIGFPMVDTGARFVIPSRFGEDVTIESAISRFGNSSFDVTHRLLRGDVLAIEAREKRVWAGEDPDRPGTLKGMPMPVEVRDALSHGPQPASNKGEH